MTLLSCDCVEFVILFWLSISLLERYKYEAHQFFPASTKNNRGPRPCVCKGVKRHLLPRSVVCTRWQPLF